MIKNIIFDIGRVLNAFQWEGYLRSVVPEEEAYKIVEKAVFLNLKWGDHDLGLKTEEEEIQDFVEAAPEYEKEIREVYENIGKCVWLYDYTESWIEELKEKGYKVFALSNWPKHVYEQRTNNLDFLEMLDGYILSYREHLIKPEPKIYETLLERYGLVAEESVFLDDTLVNVEGARKVGIHGILFKNQEQGREELRKLGVE